MEGYLDFQLEAIVNLATDKRIEIKSLGCFSTSVKFVLWRCGSAEKGDLWTGWRGMMLDGPYHEKGIVAKRE